MSGIFETYLAGGAREFYGSHFADAEDRGGAVRHSTRPLDPLVADVLVAQNSRFAPSPARDRHIELLRHGAAAAVSGQQVGLFLGPLFTFYKAASAVAAARALAKESGQPVVPVFWLQTEDHDLPEIAEAFAPSAAGTPLHLQLPSSPDDRISLAHRRLPEEVTACLALLAREIGGLPHGASHLARLEQHYRPGIGWAEAFAAVLAGLFADDGLVLLNPRDPALAPIAARIHHRALREAGPIAQALQERGAALKDAGFSAPVFIRPASPLSFFHPEGAAGPRFRLVPDEDGSGFTEVGGTRRHSLDELLDALAADPMRFSTSVLLRPILQDTLLPTAAYIGGPGEIAYFAQLSPVYAAYGMAMPLIVPRARLRLLEAKTLRLLTDLNLTPDDAARPVEQILTADSAASDLRQRIETSLLPALESALDRMRVEIEGIGPGLGSAFDKTRATVSNAVHKLADKVDRAGSQRDLARLDEVGRLKTALYPNGIPQERVYGASYFMARYGERAFHDQILAAIRPFDPRPRDVPLTDAVGDEDAE